VLLPRLGSLQVSVRSEAVTVQVPAAWNLTVKVLVPLTNAALRGNSAESSLLVMRTVSATVVIGFQVSSTALTVTLKDTSVTCGEGVLAGSS
jgi:hypothetical protein